MKNYDVIIIGAGPSGIFCAYELIHANKDLKILMIEKGRRIENRQCRRERQSMCRLSAMFHHDRICRSRSILRWKIIVISGCRWKSWRF